MVLLADDEIVARLMAGVGFADADAVEERGVQGSRAVLAGVEPQGVDEAARVFAPGDFVGGEGARCCDIRERGQVERELLQPEDVLAFTVGFDDFQGIAPVKRLPIELQQRESDILAPAVDKANVDEGHAYSRDLGGDIFADDVALILRRALKAADQPVIRQQAKGLVLLVEQAQGQRQFRARLEAERARQLPEQAVALPDFARAHQQRQPVQALIAVAVAHAAHVVGEARDRGLVEQGLVAVEEDQGALAIDEEATALAGDDLADGRADRDAFAPPIADKGETRFAPLQAKRQVLRREDADLVNHVAVAHIDQAKAGDDRAANDGLVQQLPYHLVGGHIDLWLGAGRAVVQPGLNVLQVDDRLLAAEGAGIGLDMADDAGEMRAYSPAVIALDAQARAAVEAIALGRKIAARVADGDARPTGIGHAVVCPPQAQPPAQLKHVLGDLSGELAIAVAVDGDAVGDCHGVASRASSSQLWRKAQP